MKPLEALNNIRVELRDGFDFPFNITEEYRVIKRALDIQEEILEDGVITLEGPNKYRNAHYNSEDKEKVKLAISIDKMFADFKRKIEQQEA